MSSLQEKNLKKNLHNLVEPYEFKLINLNADYFQESIKETVKNTDYIKVPNFPKTLKKQFWTNSSIPKVKPQEAAGISKTCP